VSVFVSNWTVLVCYSRVFYTYTVYLLCTSCLGTLGPLIVNVLSLATDHSAVSPAVRLTSVKTCQWNGSVVSNCRWDV